MNMHYVFIYPSSGILGGIETQMVRMSRWLVAHGHAVTVLTESDRDWGRLLPKEVRSFALAGQFKKLTYYFHAKSLWTKLNVPRPDVIKSFDFWTAWIAYQLTVIAGGKVVAGIYVPQPAIRQAHGSFYARHLVKRIPRLARIFMSPEQIEEFEAVYGEGGELWQLPVDAGQFLPATRQPKWGKLMSVGRLAVMKEYNLYMIEVVEELRQRGHDVTWTAHGTGKYEAEMREMIRARGLEKFVTLAGAMPYERCWQMLADAYVFVGMGTTILEAALFKVPNVLALAYDRAGLTYGPIYRVPLGSVGDIRKEPPTLKVADEIERILKLSPEDYAAEAERVYQYARPYESDISMQRFVELTQAAPSNDKQLWRCLVNYLYWLPRRVARILK
jgi:hypothetical protein